MYLFRTVPTPGTPTLPQCQLSTETTLWRRMLTHSVRCPFEQRPGTTGDSDRSSGQRASVVNQRPPTPRHQHTGDTSGAPPGSPQGPSGRNDTVCRNDVGNGHKAESTLDPRRQGACDPTGCLLLGSFKDAGSSGREGPSRQCHARNERRTDR